MNGGATSMEPLRVFRDRFYVDLGRRVDALFELCDAILTAGRVPSPPHLSLVSVHRRGWGSLYAALSKGRIDSEALRDLLSSYDLGTMGTPVYAVDVSPWPRCDAEASPGRGYLYHPSRHSAGQPIVAGWAYQLVARLGFERDSWVAPVDARRVEPEEDANRVAAEQVRALVVRSPHIPRHSAAPLFVFDAGYDPVRLQQSLEAPIWTIFRPYSPKCLEGVFSEVRLYAFLESSRSPGPVGLPVPLRVSPSYMWCETPAAMRSACSRAHPRPLEPPAPGTLPLPHEGSEDR